MSARGGFTMPEPRSRVPRPWTATFGSYLLCVDEPGARIVLQGVGWRAADDASPLKVQTPLRIVDRTTKSTLPFGAVAGPPWKPYSGNPHPGDYLDNVAGRSITRTCDFDTKEFTELTFVLEVGEQGADVPEAWVDYLADGEPRRLMIRWRMIGCGDAVAARDDETGATCRDLKKNPGWEDEP